MKGMGVRGWSLLAVLVASCAPRAPSRTIRFESTVHSARLGNGLRALVIEDHDTNLVDLGVRLDVGSIDDPPGKAGLAHLVEHVLFQVESQPDRRPLIAHLAAAAVAFNAYTSTDATHFRSLARADQLDRLLEVEAQRFTAACPSLTAEAFEREREVVRNELRLHRSFAGDTVGIGRLLYPPDHPHARPIGGTDASVAHLTLADVCQFLAAHYQPDRMVVVLTGDIDARAAIHAIGRTLGRLAGHSRGRRRARLPALPPLRRVQVDLPVAREGAILVEWPMPASWTPDYPAAAVALTLLQVALGRGAVFELGSERAPLAVAVIPMTAGLPDDQAITRALAKLDRAVDRAGGYAQDEILDPLIDRRTRELLSAFDDLWSRVDLMATPFQLAGDDHVVVRQLVRYDHLDRDDVRAALARTFARGRRSVVVVSPPAGRGRPAPEGAALPSLAGMIHEEDWHAPVDSSEADRRLQVPLPRERPRRAERFRLPNGLRVILLRTPAAPLVSARLMFAGGNADDPPGKEGLADRAARLLRLRDHGPAGALAEIVYGLLATPRVEVAADHTTFAADGLSSHVDAVIAMLAAQTVDGEYHARDLAPHRGGDAHAGERRESAAEQQSRARWQARDRMRVGLFAHLFGPGHPYARAQRSPFAGGGPLLTIADLEAVRERRFTADNGVLVLCGQFDPALVREHIEKRFADLRRGAAQRAVRPPARPIPGLVIEWTDEADPTTTLTLGFATRGERAGRAVRLVIAEMVRERIARLREALGAAYGIDVQQLDHPGAGAMIVTAVVDATRSGEAMDLLIDEVDRLRAGDRDLADAFVRARRRVLQQIIAESSGADQSARRIASLIAHGEGLDASGHLAREVMQLTMDDARSALAEELAPARQVTALLGAPDSVAAARRAIEVTRERRSGVSPATQ